MYFSTYPTYEYDLSNTGNRKLVTDIMRRVSLRNNVKLNTLVMDSYNVRDGDTPEIVAAKYYGDPKFHFVVLLVNGFTNRFDFPIPQRSLNDFITEKYGAGNEDSVHHHEVAQSSGDTTIKLIVSSDTTGAIAVTNREHEQNEQDNKRKIKLLDRVYLRQFVDEFDRLIRKQ